VSSDQALLASEVAAEGARSIVVDSEQDVYPVFVFVDEGGGATIVGWGGSDQPRDNEALVKAMMKANNTVVAVFVCEVVLAYDTADSDNLVICDGVAVVTAEVDDYFARMFVIDRSKPLGSDDRFVEYSSDQDGGGLDHSWLQKALLEAAS
jgi:hypothetical protein